MNDDTDPNEPCLDSKLLALHTSTVCLARALVMSGALHKLLNRVLEVRREAGCT